MPSKQFPVEVVASLSTGISLVTEFGKIHELAEWVAGHPIWTHEFASRPTWTKLHDALVAQHPLLQLLKIEVSSAEEAAAEVVRLRETLGESLSIEQGTNTRTKHPIETLSELVPGKEVIVIETE